MFFVEKLIELIKEKKSAVCLPPLCPPNYSGIDLQIILNGAIQNVKE